MSSKSLIRTNIFLSAVEREKFAKLAKQQKTSAASIIRAVLDAYLGIKPEHPAEIIFKNQPPFRAEK